MKKIKHIAVLVILTIATVATTNAQIATVSATLNKDTITIGDTLTLSLKLKNFMPGKLAIGFPVFNDTITSSVHVIQEDSIPDTLSAGKDYVLLKKSYTISAYDSGNVVIPPIPFVFKLDTVVDTIFTAPQFLFVKLVPVDTTKVPLKDIKKPVNTPLTFKEFIDRFGIYILAGILLLLIAFILLRYFRRRKEGKAFIEFKKPEEPAHVVALKRLENLRERKLWQQDKVKQYYIELTDILREYMEKQLGISAMESTSSEIIEALKELKTIDENLIKNMQRVFEIADLAKFAKFKPLPDENDFAWKKAYEFVKETMPKEEPEKNGNGDDNKTQKTDENDNTDN